MQNIESVTFEAIGTTWNIEVEVSTHIKIADVLHAVKERIEIFDKIYSRFRKDSWVFHLFKNPGTYTVPPDFKKLFDVYQKLYKTTEGLFTPTVGNLLREAGYDEDYSLRPKKLHKPPRLDTVVSFDKKTITTHIPVMLDFGAAGKGYLIDIVSEIIKSFDVKHFCVDAGRDIFYYSESETDIQVGLENPVNTSQVIGISQFHNKSICGSAGNRRAWGSFHHIVNPITLTSPDDILAVWVIADSALVADAMATALFLNPSKKVSEAYPCEYFLMYNDFSVQRSENFPAELFTSRV